jgi:hypothetical protein
LNEKKTSGISFKTDGEPLFFKQPKLASMPPNIQGPPASQVGYETINETLLKKKRQEKFKKVFSSAFRQEIDKNPNVKLNPEQ